jgi:hypothetical protein
VGEYAVQKNKRQNPIVLETALNYKRRGLQTRVKKCRNFFGWSSIKGYYGPANAQHTVKQGRKPRKKAANAKPTWKEY